MTTLIPKFQQTGTGAINRAINLKFAESVSVKDFGAVGDGLTDDTSAVQAAINYAQTSKLQLNIPNGTYKTTSTLTITTDNVSIVGNGLATIRYYGTGTALLIGVAPNVNGTFIYNTRIENLNIEVDDTTSVIMQVWHSNGGYFKNMYLYGNRGASNKGLWVNGGIYTIYEQINIVGYGQTNDGTNYLNYGLFAGLGYLNDSITTTTFRKCYFHYCDIGVHMLYSVAYEDCIFEANTIGTDLVGGAGTAIFNRCWWEANTRAGQLDKTITTFNDCLFNTYANIQMFSTGGGVQAVSFKDCKFTGAGATLQLFNDPATNNIFSASVTNGLVSLDRPKIENAGFLIGSSYNSSTSNLINVESMRKETYTFSQTGVGASYSAFITDGNGLTAIILPEYGHIISVKVWTVSAITAGTYTLRLYNSSVIKTDFNITTSATQPEMIRVAPYKNIVAQDSSLQINLVTSAAFAPNNHFIVEVVIAFGPDGF